MTETVETQIINAEERLRQAMLASDVSILNELLATQIIITSHLGESLGKQDDLAAHESGLIKIHKLEASEQHIQIYGEMAIVSVRMQMSDSYNGTLQTVTFVSREFGLSLRSEVGISSLPI